MSELEKIKELRERTGAGIMDCKKALKEADGDIERAVEVLREKGIAKSAKKLDREVKEGIIHAYIHPGDKLGVLVEINCETDFVARTREFMNFVHDIAMHIAASSPIAVSREDIPEEILETERKIYKTQAESSGKPPHVVEKIVEGKIENFYKEKCLLEQPFIKNPEVTIEEYLKEHIGKFGENIRIKRFARFKVGED